MLSTRILSAFKNRISPSIKSRSFFNSPSKHALNAFSNRTYSNFDRRKIINFKTVFASIFGSGSLLAAGWFGTKDNTLLTPDGSNSSTIKLKKEVSDLPQEDAIITLAPNVPPPIKRNHPVRLRAKMDTQTANIPLTRQHKYRAWLFNKGCPGPFIRARVGDVLEIEFTNKDEDGIAHNIDFHCVTGPGGGAPVLFTEKNQTKVGSFKLLYPGLYLYHCAAAPIPMHIANGMYGLVLVEPEEGLPPVDKEFYVMQSEFYTEPSTEDSRMLEYSYVEGLNENPQYIFFNGRESALTDNPLMAELDQTIRIYFGNAGANLTSSFHVIGAIFDKVYREGGLISPPERGISTTIVPPGAATVVELKTAVPGTMTLVDHSIYRIDKGAVGYLKVAGEQRPELYDGDDRPTPCPGCKLHE